MICQITLIVAFRTEVAVHLQHIYVLKQQKCDERLNEPAQQDIQNKI